jgi:hypothetical protein
MTESMPSNIQLYHAAQKPMICCRLSGVRPPMGVPMDAIPRAVLWVI